LARRWRPVGDTYDGVPIHSHHIALALAEARAADRQRTTMHGAAPCRLAAPAVSDMSPAQIDAADHAAAIRSSDLHQLDRHTPTAAPLPRRPAHQPFGEMPTRKNQEDSCPRL
jgi:hypothetical protein